MKTKGICLEEHPYAAKIGDAWNVDNVPTFIVMRRDADEEIGRVVGLLPETQKLIEDHVARAKTLKTDAPTPQIVEVAYQPPQDDVAALITVDDFDIPALREAAEKAEEKNRNLPRKIWMDKFLRKPFPKSLIRSRPRPRDVEARLPDDRAPCVLPPRRRMKKKILSLEPLGLLRPPTRRAKQRVSRSQSQRAGLRRLP